MTWKVGYMTTDDQQFFKDNGYCTLKSIVNQDLINKLRKMFNSAFNDFQKKTFDQFPKIKNSYMANHDTNRWNMKLSNDFLPLIDQIFKKAGLYKFLRNFKWKQLYIAYLSSDVASPGSSYQEFHQDADYFGLAVNIPLTNSSADNGATEIISKQDLKQTNKQTLALQLGDLSIRDIRTIHRGTPNKTSEHRPYLSIILLEAEENEIPPDTDLKELYERYKKLKSKLFAESDTGSIDYANEIGRSLINLAKTDRLFNLPNLSDSNGFTDEFLHLLRYSDFNQRQNMQRSHTQAEEISTSYPDLK